MQFCYQCGAQAEAEDQFCGNCGIAQPVPPPFTEKPVERAPEPPSPPPVGDSRPLYAEPQPLEPPVFRFESPRGVEPLEAGDAPRDFEMVPESRPLHQPDAPANFAPVATENFALVRDEPEAAPASPAPPEVAPDPAPLPPPLPVPPSGGVAAPRPVASAPAREEELDLELLPTMISRPGRTENPPARAAEAAPAERPPAAEERPPSDDFISRPISSTRSGTNGGRRSAPKTLDAGTVLNGRYEIVRRIGGGGMGAVYLAKDRNLGDAPRAVKEMIQSQMDETQQEKAVGDFKRESLLLTSLEHPSIPTIYDYFFDEHACRFYLVMKYISGGDLLTRLRNAPGGRIDEKTVAGWGMEIADVLDYLHSRRPPIIYRDLKPANVMIDGNSGRIMLIDFGIARWVGAQEKGVTAVGTMGYAPPELFSGKVEARSDIYSLGATMFHLLTGSDPQDNPLLIFDFNKHPRPRQINPALSNEMERLLVRTVEYKPEDRFSSAAELRDALAQHLKELGAGKVSYGTAQADRAVGTTSAVEMVFCGFCGGRIAAADLFCAFCGARQPLTGGAAGGASAALARPARVTAKLVVANTTELNASFLLQKDSNLVGRSDPNSNIFPEVDLSKFDPNTKISRRHARIWREGESFLVEDLGSINGTVLNDAVRLAPRQPRVLASGDKLRLGETTLHFLVG